MIYAFIKLISGDVAFCISNEFEDQLAVPPHEGDDSQSANNDSQSADDSDAGSRPTRRVDKEAEAYFDLWQQRHDEAVMRGYSYNEASQIACDWEELKDKGIDPWSVSFERNDEASNSNLISDSENESSGYEESKNDEKKEIKDENYNKKRKR